MFDPFLSYSDRMKVEGIYDVKLSVDANTQKMIATQEQLAAEGVEAMEANTEAVLENKEAVESMSREMVYEIRELSDGFSDKMDETNTILSWGFADISNSLKRMEGTLQSLLESVSDTDRAWAYAQYQKCLENYRKGLHKEAVERVRYAIEGHGDAHIGEKEDYRFHFLLGSLYLGRKIKKPDPSVLDSEKAEKAFLLSAYYAEADHKKETAKAYLNAGVSAILQGENTRALDHVQNALSIDGELAEAYFLKGKILCRLGKDSEAFGDAIKKAIEIHPMYAEKSAVDVDIKKHTSALNSVIVERVKELKKESDTKIKLIHNRLKETDETASKLKTVAISADVLSAKKNVTKIILSAEKEIQSNTLFGVWDGLRKSTEALNQYKDVVFEYLEDALHTEKIEALKNSHISKVDKEMENVRSFRNTFLISVTISVALIFVLIQTLVLLGKGDFGFWTLFSLFMPMILIGASFLFGFADDLFESLGPTLLLFFLGGIMYLGYPEYGWMTLLASPILYAMVIGLGALTGLILGLILRAILYPKSTHAFKKKKTSGESDIESDKKILMHFKEGFLM